MIKSAIIYDYELQNIKSEYHYKLMLKKKGVPFTGVLNLQPALGFTYQRVYEPELRATIIKWSNDQSDLCSSS